MEILKKEYTMEELYNSKDFNRCLQLRYDFDKLYLDGIVIGVSEKDVHLKNLEVLWSMFPPIHKSPHGDYIKHSVTYNGITFFALASKDECEGHQTINI